jgi:hypothetical protein
MVDMSVQAIQLSDQIAELTKKIEAKYGCRTSRWKEDDPDVKQVKLVGFKLWHALYGDDQVAAKVDPALDDRWRKIIKLNDDALIPFESLPRRTRYSWTTIFSLNEQYDGPLRPTFKYRARPIKGTGVQIFSLTVLNLKTILHMQQARKSDIDELAAKRGYVLSKGHYAWHCVRMGDAFMIDETRPPILRTTDSFAECCRRKEYYAGF